MKQFENRHALVTGANRGIGEATAHALANAGAAVTLLVRDRAAGEKVMGALPGRGQVVVADVTDETQVREACRLAVDQIGPVHMLINNAGYVETAPFLRSDRQLFERMLAVHLYGPLFCTQALLPSMLEHGYGRIVNIASIAGVGGAPYISAYCAAKHALVGLTRSLSKETIARGVTVNAVCPGYTETELVTKGVAEITARTGRSAEDARAALVAHSPLQRFITPDEVTAAVMWLCSDGAASTNGQAVVIDGGEFA